MNGKRRNNKNIIRCRSTSHSQCELRVQTGNATLPNLGRRLPQNRFESRKGTGILMIIFVRVEKGP